MINLQQLIKYLQRAKTDNSSLSTSKILKLNNKDQQNIIIDNVSWIKMGTFSYKNFLDEGNIKSIVSSYKIPNKSFVSSCILETNKEFIGGSISTCNIKVGIYDLDSMFLTNTDINIKSFVLNHNIVYSARKIFETLPVDVVLTLESVDDTLNKLTQGSFDIYLLINTLPGDY